MAKWSTVRSRYLLQFDNDNAVARERCIGRGNWMTVKVTRNEWLLRFVGLLLCFRQGKSTGDVEDDDDSVNSVDIDKVLGFPPVETVDNDDACGGGRRVRIFRRRRRGGTVCHVFGLLFSLHERAI